MRLLKDPKVILQGYNPRGIYARAVYEFLCILLCWSVPIVEIATTEWYWYFILYSYWAVTVTNIAFTLCFMSSIGKLIPHFKDDKLHENENYVWWLNVIESNRDAWVVLSLIQISISTLAFWPFSELKYHGYPSTMAHGGLLILLFIEFLLIVARITWRSLELSLFFDGMYYCFNMVYYLITRYWAYTLENPDYTHLWYILPIAATVLNFIFYLMYKFINYAKELLLVEFQSVYGFNIVHQSVQFEVSVKEWERVELMMSLSTMAFVICYSSTVTTISLIWIINTSPILFTVHIAIEVILALAIIISYAMAMDYIYFKVSHVTLQNTRLLTRVLIFIYMLRLCFSLVFLFVFLWTDAFWLYLSTGLMSLIIIVSLLWLYYIIHVIMGR